MGAALKTTPPPIYPLLQKFKECPQESQKCLFLPLSPLGQYRYTTEKKQGLADPANTTISVIIHIYSTQGARRRKNSCDYEI